MKQSHSPTFALLAACTTLALSGCGESTTPAAEASANPVPATASTIEPASPVGAAGDLAAREQEIAAREADLALKEREAELARREAALAARETQAAAPKTVKQAPPSPKPTATMAGASAPARAHAPVATPINVPAGTPLAIEFTDGISTRTAQVGDRVQARLASDVVVDGRKAAVAGSTLQGTVTEVVSGSSKIGGTPTLGLAFDTLTLPDGANVPISARLVRQGTSDTARDTAKIVGGAAAGAVIGHQVDHDEKGRVIGGVLGGAAGALAARKTGSEVKVPAGTVVSMNLETPFEIGGR